MNDSTTTDTGTIGLTMPSAERPGTISALAWWIIGLGFTLLMIYLFFWAAGRGWGRGVAVVKA